MYDVVGVGLTAVGVVTPAVTAAIAAGITTHLITRWSLKRTTVQQFKYFPQPDNGGFNERFYSYLGQKFETAHGSVIVSGDGFETAEYAMPRGQSIIGGYHDAIKKALRKDVRIMRIQTRNNIGPEWAAMLKELLDDFPDRFELYYLPTDRNTNIMNFCVIDPDVPQSCTVELMIASKLIHGKTSLRFAGTALFIQGDMNLARTFHNQALSIKNSPGTVHIKNSDLVDEILVGGREPPRLSAVSVPAA